MLWPDNAPGVARHSLRTTLSSLRRQLEPPGFVPGSVLLAPAFNPHSLTTDVAQFKAAVRSAQANHDSSKSSWLAAVELL